MTDPLREAATALIHLWQNDARTALVSLEVWPELGEAIDQVGEALAPARACLHCDEMPTGDAFIERFHTPGLIS